MDPSEIWRELRPHALWDFLKWCAAGSTGALTGEWVRRARSNRISVIDGNVQMTAEVSRLLDRKASSIRKVIVIQYSGANCLHVVQDILKRSAAEVEVYLVDPDSALKGHQEDRVSKIIRDFPNETREKHEGANIRLFTYRAPGSMRALLIEDQVLYFGLYQYEVIPELQHKLDTRGREKPLFVVRTGHPAFDTLAHEIRYMVDNWTTVKDNSGCFVCREVPLHK